MARTLLTVGAGIVVPLGPSPGTVSAGNLDANKVAADNVNGNSFAAQAGDKLLAEGAGTVTILSVADARKRKADITAYTVLAAATGCSLFHFGDLQGWMQSDGTIWIDTSAATVKLLVIREAAFS